jgi:hypothetical protein
LWNVNADVVQKQRHVQEEDLTVSRLDPDECLARVFP